MPLQTHLKLHCLIALSSARVFKPKDLEGFLRVEDVSNPQKHAVSYDVQVLRYLLLYI